MYFNKGWIIFQEPEETYLEKAERLHSLMCAVTDKVSERIKISSDLLFAPSFTAVLSKLKLWLMLQLQFKWFKFLYKFLSACCD